MHELWTLLWEENAGQDVFMEPILDPKVALKVALEKVRKFILQVFSWTALREWKIFVVGKQAEVLFQNVLKIIKHRKECIDLVGVNSSLPYWIISRIRRKLLALFLFQFL